MTKAELRQQLDLMTKAGLVEFEPPDTWALTEKGKAFVQAYPPDSDPERALAALRDMVDSPEN